MRFKVELLEDATNFILLQPVKMQAKIQRTIGLLKEFGYELPEPHSKKIKGIDDLHNHFDAIPTHGYDYLALRMTRHEQDSIGKLINKVGRKPIKRFANKKGDQVLIFKVNRHKTRSVHR